MPAKTPIRALARSLEVLRALSRDGAQSLDQLTDATGLPRASLARLLDSLSAVGAAARDPQARRWHALVRVVSVDVDLDLRARCLPQLVALATNIKYSCELYAVNANGLAMIERADPEGAVAPVRARLGHTPASDECSALSQIVQAFSAKPPLVRSWWIATPTGRQALTLKRARTLIATANRLRCGRDEKCNDIGIRRLAIPIQTADGTLDGVIAVAQAVEGKTTDAMSERIVSELTVLDRRLNRGQG